MDSIVFDLDKTLIFTSSSTVQSLYASGIMEDPRFFPAQSRIYYFDLPGRVSKKPNGQIQSGDSVSRMWGSIRPYGRDFLKFCFRRFKRVIVWTAGTAEYAVAICDALFRGIGKPYMIWSRGHCVLLSEPAVEVDKRLVEKGFYDSRGVDDSSRELEYMNAKPLQNMVEYIRIIENDPNVNKDTFMIVEDNYHSFISKDSENAFLISPYQSSTKSDINAIPGTPGYSPNRQKGVQNEEASESIDEEEEEEDDGSTEAKAEREYNIKLEPNSKTPIPNPSRNTVKYNWLLLPDETLVKLQNLIETKPNATASELTILWNNMTK